MKFLLLEQVIIQNVPAQARNASEESSDCALNGEIPWDLGLPMMKQGLGRLCGRGGLGTGDKPHPRSLSVSPTEIYFQAMLSVCFCCFSLHCADSPISSRKRISY